MNILVTGGAGYIGSHCAHLLCDKGHSVTILDNLSTGRKASIAPNAQFVEANVGDIDLVKSVLTTHKIEAVIHFAAFIEVEESTHDPLKYYRNNTENTLKLLEACKACKVHKFIFSSTAAVYGNPKTIPIIETDEKKPINPYGQSKWMSEVALQSLTDSYDKSLPKNERFRFIALRYFNVAGASAKYNLGQVSKKATHLIKIACETATGKRKDMKVFGDDYNTPDGTCVRDYIHVDDLAQAHLDALESLNNGSESNQFNCGYGTGYSVKEVLSTFQRATETEFPISAASRRNGDPAALTANCDKIKQSLGWSPQFNDLELICKSALKWEQYLQN